MGDSNDDDHLVRALPTAYAVAVRLHRRGATDGEIAIALGVDATVIPQLLEVGLGKLEELRRELE